MATICADGFLVSDVHLLILAEFLLDNGKEWATKGLQGMVNKATTAILKDYLEAYKATQTEPVSTQLSVLIPAILGMQSFVPYNIPTPPSPCIDCGRVRDQQLWPDGFTIEAWELSVIQAYYANCEDYMRFLMTNKVYQRGMTFVKNIEAAWQDDPAHPTMPPSMPDLIIAYTSEPGYLNRAQREAQ
jgi:hypothetical protein